MRLKSSKSKNIVLYYIIKDFTNIKGKRTTKIFKKLDNQKHVKKRFGKYDTINKIEEYINELNNEDKDKLLKREYNPNKKLLLELKDNSMLIICFLKNLYKYYFIRHREILYFQNCQISECTQQN